MLYKITSKKEELSIQEEEEKNYIKGTSRYFFYGLTFFYILFLFSLPFTCTTYHEDFYLK